MNGRIEKLRFTKRQKIATVGVTSCWHVGSPSCREKRIVSMLERWKENRTPWVNLGDTIDGIASPDKRYHCETAGLTITSQLERVAELSYIAKNTMIGTVIGNHDNSLSKYIGCCVRHMLHIIYNHSNAEYRWLGAAAMVDFECPEGTCRGLFTHSNISMGGDTSDPDRDDVNKRIRLRRRLQHFDGDFKVVGHGHTCVIAPPVTFDVLSISKDRKEHMIKKPLRPEWCGMCPSMFASYGNEDYPSYAEMAMYPPQDIGYLEVDINRDGTVNCIRPMLAD